MTREEIREEISIELEAIQQIVTELLELAEDIADQQPNVREKTAAGAFLAQFYNGIENLLKRISKYYNIEIPKGENWHVELFKRFCYPPMPPLPELFKDELPALMAPYRRFRHVFFHGYGFQLEWEQMQGGILNISKVFNKFQGNLNTFLENL
jgi:hypothetical protein